MSGFRLKAPRPKEADEQAALFQWAAIEGRRDQRLRLLFAIPNGMGASSIAEAVKHKRTGMKRGVPDLFLPVPAIAVMPDGERRFHYCGLFIELKRVGGTPCDVSPEQSAWMADLNRMGYRAVVAYGWQHAVEEIQGYLGKPG